MCDLNNLTKMAQNALAQYFRKYYVYDVVEKVTFDGADELGPKADLWTLKITTEEPQSSGKFIKYVYKCENWHDGKKPHYEFKYYKPTHYDPI
jgi:hypothetical protein